MKLKDKLGLCKEDYIIAAHAEFCAGPGYSNTPIFIVIKDGNGKLREQYIQPEDQTPEMIQLFEFSALSHRRMKVAINKALK